MKKNEKTTARSAKNAATKNSPTPKNNPTEKTTKAAKRNNIGAMHNDFVVNF